MKPNRKSFMSTTVIGVLGLCVPILIVRLYFSFNVYNGNNNNGLASRTKLGNLVLTTFKESNKHEARIVS